MQIKENKRNALKRCNLKGLTLVFACMYLSCCLHKRTFTALTYEYHTSWCYYILFNNGTYHNLQTPTNVIITKHSPITESFLFTLFLDKTVPWSTLSAKSPSFPNWSLTIQNNANHSSEPHLPISLYLPMYPVLLSTKPIDKLFSPV